jgi:hypothetical protein
MLVEYNSNGDETKRKDIDVSTNMAASYTFEYRGSLLIKKISKLGDFEPDIQVYKYNSSNDVSSEIYRVKDNKEILLLRTKTNPSQQIIEELNFDDSGEISSKSTYEYDSHGNRTKSTIEDISFGSSSVTTDKYNELNLPIESEMIRNGIIKMSCKYRYKGDKLIEKTLVAYGQILTSTYAYNGNDQLIKEEKSDTSNTIKNIITYNYLSDGLIDFTTEVKPGTPNKEIKTVYKYEKW